DSGDSRQTVNNINDKWKTQEQDDALLKEAKKRTAIADARLDEEGKTIKKEEGEDLKNDEGVVLVESRALLAREQPAVTSDDAGPDSTDDVVPLNGKSRKVKKKKPREEE